jgi:hypothetical protein
MPVIRVHSVLADRCPLGPPHRSGLPGVDQPGLHQLAEAPRQVGGALLVDPPRVQARALQALQAAGQELLRRDGQPRIRQHRGQTVSRLCGSINIGARLLFPPARIMICGI